MSGQNPREIALEVLQRRQGGNYVEAVLEGVLADSPLSPSDRGLCQELVYGVVRWQATLDWLISKKTTHRVQKPALQNLLQLGLYQIFFLSRIPNHAAVHETVEVARRIGFNTQAGFINAVLRGYLREVDQTRAALSDLKRTDPALGYSHPSWLFERWQKNWGAEKAIQLLEWNNQPPKTFARVNTLKADAAKLIESWRGENVEYDFARYDWVEENLVFLLKSHPSVASLPSFQKGMFYIQDPSTLLSVRELAAQPGEALLDMCAAPGGKLTHIAQQIRNEGRLLAHDVSVERLNLVKENCARLGVTCVKAISPDELSLEPPASFDRILVDAPCSNTGVMRRRVDLRWRIRPEELKRLQTAQLDLLKKTAPLLKPGGCLVYSTCSLEPEENDQVVDAFLKEEVAFTKTVSRQLLPWVEAVDGAYVTRLNRR